MTSAQARSSFGTYHPCCFGTGREATERWLLHFLGTGMRTNVYVDGFNLYFGCVKGTPYRWLDLARLSTLLLPRNTINRIRYFTALVSPRPGHPNQSQHQQTYLRALRTIPNLSIHLGSFLTHEVFMPRAGSPAATPTYVKVVKTEEKGSDVNLATHLLCDAFYRDFEVAVIISNDSDLLEPLKVVKVDHGLPVGVLNPHKHPSRVLHANATFFKTIRSGVLAASQFPVQLTDRHGTIAKPPGW